MQYSNISSFLFQPLHCNKLAENTSDLWLALPLIQALLPGPTAATTICLELLTLELAFSTALKIF